MAQMSVRRKRAVWRPLVTPSSSSSSSSSNNRDKWWSQSQTNTPSIMNLADLSKLKRVSSRYRDIRDVLRASAYLSDNMLV